MRLSNGQNGKEKCLLLACLLVACLLARFKGRGVVVIYIWHKVSIPPPPPPTGPHPPDFGWDLAPPPPLFLGREIQKKRN